MNKKVFFLVLSLFAALVLPGVLSAQGGLDSSQETNFGSISLQGGFLPDPYIVTLLSGGDVDAGAQNLGEGCRGNVTSNPDLQITYSEPSSYLRLFYVGSGDTTMIVQQPDGSFICNDDGVGTDPVVEISNPVDGDYFLWVGTFNSTDFIPGYLMISEFSDSAPGAIRTDIAQFITTFAALDGGTDTQNPTVPTPTPISGTSNSAGGLNAGGTPTYGVSTLAGGFSPDPVQVSVSSGGPVDVTAANIGADCRGNAAANPDHQIQWSGSAALLRIFFVSDGDTTLVVRTPSGQFLCNDDFPGGLNPLVDVANPAAGTYDVWVGTFGSSDVVPGTLYITSSNSNDPTKF